MEAAHIILQLQNNETYNVPLEMVEFSGTLDALPLEPGSSIPININLNEQVLQYLFPHQFEPDFQYPILQMMPHQFNFINKSEGQRMLTEIDFFGDVVIQPVGINESIAIDASGPCHSNTSECGPYAQNTLALNNRQNISRSMVWDIVVVSNGSDGNGVFVRFRNVHTKWYLRNFGDRVAVDTRGWTGSWTLFKVHYHGGNEFTFESVQFGTFLSVNQAGLGRICQVSRHNARKFKVLGTNWIKLLTAAEHEWVKEQIRMETLANGNNDPIDFSQENARLACDLLKAADYFSHDLGKKLAKKILKQYLTQDLSYIYSDAEQQLLYTVMERVSKLLLMG